MKQSFWDRTIPEWLAAVLGLVGAVIVLAIIIVVYWFVEVR